MTGNNYCARKLCTRTLTEDPSAQVAPPPAVRHSTDPGPQGPRNNWVLGPEVSLCTRNWEQGCERAVTKGCVCLATDGVAGTQQPGQPPASPIGPPVYKNLRGAGRGAEKRRGREGSLSRVGLSSERATNQTRGAKVRASSAVALVVARGVCGPAAAAAPSPPSHHYHPPCHAG